MKKMILIVLLFIAVANVLAEDILVTKKGQKYHGRIIKRTQKGLVVRTVEGSVIVLPVQNISKIYRDNKVLDFEEGMSYYLETRRPFLPFVVLAIASGAYCVDRFNKYKKDKDESDAIIADSGDTDNQYIKDSKKAMAASIISGLFSVGSLYIALKPMEVRVPIGRLKLSTTSKGVTLALHF